jgi:plastin-1
MLPMDAETDDLFHATANGILLCKLLHSISPDSIDMRAVNIKKIDIYRVKENLNLAIAAAAGIGCKTVGTNPQAFIEKKPHLILGYLWQVLRINLAKDIDL